MTQAGGSVPTKPACSLQFSARVVLAQAIVLMQKLNAPPQTSSLLLWFRVFQFLAQERFSSSFDKGTSGRSRGVSRDCEIVNCAGPRTLENNEAMVFEIQ